MTPAELHLWRKAGDEPRLAQLLADGYVVAHEVLRVERELALGDLPAHGSPMRYRPAGVMPYDDFLRLFAAALAGTHNRFAGSRTPAQSLAWIIRRAGDTFDPASWAVATLDGEPAGLVMPQLKPRHPGRGGIAFVGLLPPFRGRGLGRPLHALGLALLEARGARRYLGHTDVENRAVARIFTANGCRPVGVLACLRHAGADAGTGLLLGAHT